MVLTKNCHFFHFVFSVKTVCKIVFEYVLHRKHAFLDYINIVQSHFSKGLNPWFWPEILLFFHFVFSVKIVRKIVFEYFLFSKQSLLDYKKYPSYMVKKLDFSKGVNQLFWPKCSFFQFRIFGQNSL